MLLWVPEPVCHTTSGNASASWPARISSHTRPISSAFSAEQHAGVAVGEGGGFLQVGEGGDNFLGHPVDVLRNGEVLDGALRLGAPVGGGGHLHGAHGVLFGAESHAVVDW